ncbi:uncharacterized protein L203_101712 [Cryptococcus depauperatus CBS 7841]|uniref:Uncharacterized protein n=1 Tax=Cryptococcus depauperatus CBS 7841 TaxID=1295531 RepID=A0A1E3HPT7_9TREE|nr:hypothetical protein L203_06235 [Cryptococcus depauperatus CBS 7841]
MVSRKHLSDMLALKKALPISARVHTSAHVPMSHAHLPRASYHGATTSQKKPSPHASWYREIVPAMLPIFVISTTIFLSLSLLRTHLSHSKSLAESEQRIAELESELQRARIEQKRQMLREKKERERILPMVVERVLQRVGVVGGEEQEEDKVEVRLL